MGSDEGHKCVFPMGFSHLKNSFILALFKADNCLNSVIVKAAKQFITYVQSKLHPRKINAEYKIVDKSPNFV